LFTISLPIFLSICCIKKLINGFKKMVLRKLNSKQMVSGEKMVSKKWFQKNGFNKWFQKMVRIREMFQKMIQ